MLYWFEKGAVNFHTIFSAEQSVSSYKKQLMDLLFIIFVGISFLIPNTSHDGVIGELNKQPEVGGDSLEKTL